MYKKASGKFYVLTQLSQKAKLILTLFFWSQRQGKTTKISILVAEMNEMVSSGDAMVVSTHQSLTQCPP